MTITSRGAVAPTADQASQTAGSDAATTPAAPLDTDALDAAVTLVADHAPGWVKTDATARPNCCKT